MRFLLVRGKQKELIKKYKKEYKLTFNQLASFLNIKPGRLKAYFDESALIPEGIFTRLNKSFSFEKFIRERREDNWGQVKGGGISRGKLKQIRIPNDSEDFAEFYGAMLGDGNSFFLKKYKIGVYMIRIVGDLNLDKDYHLNYLKPRIENLFGVNVREGRFKSNARYIEVHSKKLVEYLWKRGFIPGNKIKNQLDIPDWISKNEVFLKACLRGLYDTDGSIYKLTNQNSYQICFTNMNSVLLNSVMKSLLRLGINCSKISKGKEIYITKKSELRKFLKLIGFSNQRHLCRLEVFRPYLGL